MDENEKLLLVSDGEPICEALSATTKCRWRALPLLPALLGQAGCYSHSMGYMQVLWLYSCIQRSEMRPEKRQECWHYTALAIKCSSVRGFSARNQ